MQLSCARASTYLGSLLPLQPQDVGTYLSFQHSLLWGQLKGWNSSLRCWFRFLQLFWTISDGCVYSPCQMALVHGYRTVLQFSGLCHFVCSYEGSASGPISVPDAANASLLMIAGKGVVNGLLLPSSYPSLRGSRLQWDRQLLFGGVAVGSLSP